jgi:hypothetical protein
MSFKQGCQFFFLSVQYTKAEKKLPTDYKITQCPLNTYNSPNDQNL